MGQRNWVHCDALNDDTGISPFSNGIFFSLKSFVPSSIVNLTNSPHIRLMLFFFLFHSFVTKNGDRQSKNKMRKTTFRCGFFSSSKDILRLKIGIVPVCENLFSRYKQFQTELISCFISRIHYFCWLNATSLWRIASHDISPKGLLMIQLTSHLLSCPFFICFISFFFLFSICLCVLFLFCLIFPSILT